MRKRKIFIMLGMIIILLGLTISYAAFVPFKSEGRYINRRTGEILSQERYYGIAFSSAVRAPPSWQLDHPFDQEMLERADVKAIPERLILEWESVLKYPWSTEYEDIQHEGRHVEGIAMSLFRCFSWADENNIVITNDKKQKLREERIKLWC